MDPRHHGQSRPCRYLSKRPKMAFMHLVIIHSLNHRMGTEDWILYHANSKPGQGCGNDRSPRAQKIGWKKDGSPDFGIPLKEGLPLDMPSGN
jgi:hypothetical protein